MMNFREDEGIRACRLQGVQVDSTDGSTEGSVLDLGVLLIVAIALVACILGVAIGWALGSAVDGKVDDKIAWQGDGKRFWVVGYDLKVEQETLYPVWTNKWAITIYKEGTFFLDRQEAEDSACVQRKRLRARMDTLLIGCDK